MNFLIILPMIAIMVILAFSRRVGTLAWVLIWWMALFLGFTRGINPPMPSSVTGMYMVIITIALFTYVACDKKRVQEAWGPIKKFTTDDKFKIPLLCVLLVLTIAVGIYSYKKNSAKVEPPYIGRTIHPAPPGKTTFQGKSVDLLTVVNPYRELEKADPQKFKEHGERGRRVYYENCLYCHGDNMTGLGLFAHGFDPLPANFQDVGTIAQLEEGFLFWRISKGGPGLPEESTPWSSSMPAWENFLSEDDIWDVIVFLYDFTGQKPRAKEEIH